MKLLIATAVAPKSKENFEPLCNILRNFVRNEGLEIKGGILWTYGQGCCNVAMDIPGEDAAVEKVADRLTIALMPAKWTNTNDEIPDHDVCDLLLDPEPKKEEVYKNTYVFKVTFLDEDGRYLSSEEVKFEAASTEDAREQLDSWAEEEMSSVEGAEDFEDQLIDVH